MIQSKKLKIGSRVLTSEGFLKNYRNFYLTVFEIEGGTNGRRTDDGRNITPIAQPLAR